MKSDELFMEFFVGGRGFGKTSSMRESIKKSFECSCMTDDLLDSLLSSGTSMTYRMFECRHGYSLGVV